MVPHGEIEMFARRTELESNSYQGQCSTDRESTVGPPDPTDLNPQVLEAAIRFFGADSRSLQNLLGRERHNQLIDAMTMTVANMGPTIETIAISQ